MKISPNNLIIASLMAAPGALAISKTIYPETKKTKANWEAIRNLPKGYHIFAKSLLYFLSKETVFNLIKEMRIICSRLSQLEPQIWLAQSVEFFRI